MVLVCIIEKKESRKKGRNKETTQKKREIRNERGCCHSTAFQCVPTAATHRRVKKTESKLWMLYVQCIIYIYRERREKTTTTTLNLGHFLLVPDLEIDRSIIRGGTRTVLSVPHRTCLSFSLVPMSQCCLFLFVFLCFTSCNMYDPLIDIHPVLSIVVQGYCTQFQEGEEKKKNTRTRKKKKRTPDEKRLENGEREGTNPMLSSLSHSSHACQHNTTHATKHSSQTEAHTAAPATQNQ